MCEHHEHQIKEFLASNKKRIRRKSRGTTLTGTPAPEQHLRPTTVSTEGGAGATFVSDISSKDGLGNVVIKANTTVFNATKLAIPLTTSTSVSALIADAIRRQVASDIKIDFPEGTPTTLTIEQLTFAKENVATAHPNSHGSAPITALVSVFFFQKGPHIKRCWVPSCGEDWRRSHHRSGTTNIRRLP